MQPAVSGFHCLSCNHLMIAMDVTGIFGEHTLCPKPIVVMVNYQLNQLQPTDSYSMGADGDELFKITEDISISTKSDQSSLYSEGISYEETGSVYNCDSYNSLDDKPTVNTSITVEHDELVIPIQHKSLSSDSDHTIMCRYCRGEVKNCHYDYHLVRCSEYSINCRFSSGNPFKKIRYQESKAVKRFNTENEIQHNGNNFIVNCIAVQETVHRLM